MQIRCLTNVGLVSLVGLFALSFPVITFAEFETEKGWNGHLFPSFIIATATMKPPEPPADPPADPPAENEQTDDQQTETEEGEGEEAAEDTSDTEEEVTIVYGDMEGLLGVTLQATADDQKVKVTISCDSIMEPSKMTCTLPEAGKWYGIHPKIKYKYDQLAKRSQTGPITVTYCVEVDGEDAEETSEILTLRSINDCPLAYEKNGIHYRFPSLFAAYVNEQHPFVDKILREALNSNIVNSFEGYQEGTDDDVFRQVYAIWHALSQRDVRYSSITSTVAGTDAVFSQHVRLIEESINNGQANCVDGSVLLASLLRKIDIEPFLVRVPGHCYLGFYVNKEHTIRSFLETTKIGMVIQGEVKTLEGLENVVNEKTRTENSWKTFMIALGSGFKRFDSEREKFNDETDLSYKIISVAKARNAGILPIGFQSGHEFSEAASRNRGR